MFVSSVARARSKKGKQKIDPNDVREISRAGVGEEIKETTVGPPRHHLACSGGGKTRVR
jgi:hypothetical protein